MATADLHITEAEAEILAALWRRGPLSPARLIAEVKDQRPWGEATIKTLLGRLMQKKIVRSERHEGLVYYHPQITREAYVGREVDLLVDRLFGGDRAALARFIAGGD